MRSLVVVINFLFFGHVSVTHRARVLCVRYVFQVFEEWRSLSVKHDRKSTLAFCVSVDHANSLRCVDLINTSFFQEYFQ